MVDFRLVLTALIALVSIAVPAYVTAMFLGWAVGAIVAVFIAIGIGFGRWLASGQQGGQTGGGSPVARRRQSKGARGGRDR